MNMDPYQCQALFMDLASIAQTFRDVVRKAKTVTHIVGETTAREHRQIPLSALESLFGHVNAKCRR